MCFFLHKCQVEQFAYVFLTLMSRRTLYIWFFYTNVTLNTCLYLIRTSAQISVEHFTSILLAQISSWTIYIFFFLTLMTRCDHLFSIVVSTSDCHPRDPGFDSRLYPRKFSGSIGSGTGFTQPHEDNWVAIWMRSSEIRLRKLKLRLRDERFANHKTLYCLLAATASVGLGSSRL